MRISDLVRSAVHCSVFLSPTDPGLSENEIVEVGKRLGFLEGEINDAIQHSRRSEEVRQFLGRARLEPRPNREWCNFIFRDDPDFRNVVAYDYLTNQLELLAREHGFKNVAIERAVLVERGVSAGLDRRDIDATITVMVLGEHLVEKDSVVRLHPRGTSFQSASEQIDQNDEPPRPNEMMRRAYDVVADVIARRADGRAAAAEPLDAFAETLARLGYAPFRMWWTQTVAELRKLEPTLSPVSATVLSAALVEGALTFLVRHARTLGVGPFKSKDFDGDPRTWKIDDLVKSAAAGGDAAILDHGARLRADEVIHTRQRIHAGRMLSEFRNGPPDLRPEEAREARRTAELIVRRVLDWLERFPPPAQISK